MLDGAVVRDAVPADAEAVAAIYNHYVDRTTTTFEIDPIDAREVARRMAVVRQAGYWWLVAEVEGAVAGYTYANGWNTRAAYRNTAETSVYLSPAATGRGLGTALYAQLFDRLRAAGVHVVIAGIALPNSASVRLHERFGMRKVAHFEQVGRKFDRWIDVGYWQVVLDASAPAPTAT